MAFLKKHSKSSSPPSRQVTMLGRTMPYSYHARRSSEPRALGRQLLSSAVNARHAKKVAHYWRQRFGLFLIILAILFGVANLLTLDTSPVVKPLSGSGAVAFLHSLPSYQRTAERLFGSSLLNHNKITVDTASVERGLKKAYPELSVVSVTLPLFGHRPYIYISQADPALVLRTQTNQRFIIDTQGRAIAATNVSASSDLLEVRDQSGSTIHLGDLALPSTTVGFIRAVHFQLAQRQAHVSYVTLPPSGSELDVYMAGTQYFVKFNLASGTALQQAGTFLATQQYFEERGIDPSQYVDVRVDGRAYYR